jgi:hypothetical protein
VQHIGSPKNHGEVVAVSGHILGSHFRCWRRQQRKLTGEIRMWGKVELYFDASSS